MTKSPVARGAGNVNMKGKKYKLMSCRCCVVIDFRERAKKALDKKEMKHYSCDKVE